MYAVGCWSSQVLLKTLECNECCYSPWWGSRGDRIKSSCEIQMSPPSIHHFGSTPRGVFKWIELAFICQYWCKPILCPLNVSLVAPQRICCCAMPFFCSLPDLFQSGQRKRTLECWFTNICSALGRWHLKATASKVLERDEIFLFRSLKFAPIGIARPARSCELWGKDWLKIFPCFNSLCMIKWVGIYSKIVKKNWSVYLAIRLSCTSCTIKCTDRWTGGIIGYKIFLAAWRQKK